MRMSSQVPENRSFFTKLMSCFLRIFFVNVIELQSKLKTLINRKNDEII